jgi:prepilin-type N-terminal cleavage/methylation domain-containing protein
LKNNNKGFTLVEVTIASSLGLFILSAAMYLMIQAFAIARDAFADYYLTAQGRVLRERLLRRIDGNNGMRDAVWDSIDVRYQNTHAEKFFYNYLNVSTNGDWPDITDYEKVLVRRESKRVAYKSTFDSTYKYPLNNEEIYVQNMYHKLVGRNDLTCEPRHIISEYYLKIKIDGTEYDQYYYVKTAVVNDENM